MPKRTRSKVFSVLKAVKANARARVGTPPPSAPIVDRKTKDLRGRPKYKRSLEEVIQAGQEDSFQ